MNERVTHMKYDITKRSRRVRKVLISLLAIMSVTVLSVVPVAADTGSAHLDVSDFKEKYPPPLRVQNGDLFFGEAVSDGNIYELCGFERSTSGSGVNFKSFEDSIPEVNALKANNDIYPGKVIGYLIEDGIEVILLQIDEDSVIQYIFSGDKVIQNDLYLETVGTWENEDGSVSMGIRELRSTEPVYYTDGWPIVVWHSYTQKEQHALSCSYTAIITAWVDDSSGEWLGYADGCYYTEEGEFLIYDDYSTATIYGDIAYAGGDAEFWNPVIVPPFLPATFWQTHGAWVTVTKEGDTSHGGYSDSGFFWGWG
jgi:hypothetical protein